MSATRAPRPSRPPRPISPMSWRKGTGIAGRSWTGAVREYDLFKELTIGVIAVTLLVLAASAIFSSPDDKAVSLKSWATAQPADFIATATAELGGTSETAGYGPPYNSTAGATQTLGPIDLQSLPGVAIPIDTAKDFVIGPLSTLPNPPAEVASWMSATADQQTAWTTAYAKALDKAKLRAKFDALAPSHQKEHVRAIDEAKQPETRARRIDAMLTKLRG